MSYGTSVDRLRDSRIISSNVATVLYCIGERMVHGYERGTRKIAWVRSTFTGDYSPILSLVGNPDAREMRTLVTQSIFNKSDADLRYRIEVYLDRVQSAAYHKWTQLTPENRAEIQTYPSEVFGSKNYCNAEAKYPIPPVGLEVIGFTWGGGIIVKYNPGVTIRDLVESNTSEYRGGLTGPGFNSSDTRFCETWELDMYSALTTQIFLRSLTTNLVPKILGTIGYSDQSAYWESVVHLLLRMGGREHLVSMGSVVKLLDTGLKTGDLALEDRLIRVELPSWDRSSSIYRIVHCRKSGTLTMFTRSAWVHTHRVLSGKKPRGFEGAGRNVYV